jgi:hypothetical protein
MHRRRSMFDDGHLPFHHRGGRATRGALIAGGAVIVLVAIAATTSRLHEWQRPPPNPALARQAEALDRRIAAEERTTVEAPLELNAVDLSRAYLHDQPGADQRYLGHQLLVSGVVKSVASEQQYDTLVKLRGAGIGASVRATLAEWEAPRAAQLKRGDRVKLLCTGGARILQSPSLHGCIIQ